MIASKTSRRTRPPKGSLATMATTIPRMLHSSADAHSRWASSRPRSAGEMSEPKMPKGTSSCRSVKIPLRSRSAPGQWRAQGLRNPPPLGSSQPAIIYRAAPPSGAVTLSVRPTVTPTVVPSPSPRQPDLAKTRVARLRAKLGVA